MKKHKNCILVGIGTFIGVMAGLTLAQRKGKDLRKDLHQAFDKDGMEGKWKVMQKEIAACGKEFLRAVREIGARKDVQELVEKGKVKANELKKQGKDKLQELKKTGVQKAKQTKKRAVSRAKARVKKVKAKKK